MKFYILLALVVVALLTYSEARDRRNIGQGAGYNQGIGGGAQPNWNNNGYNNGIGGGAQPNYNNNNNYNAYGSSGNTISCMSCEGSGCNFNQFPVRCDPTNKCYTVFHRDGSVQRKGCSRFGCSQEASGQPCQDCTNNECNKDHRYSPGNFGAMNDPVNPYGGTNIGGGAVPNHGYRHRSGSALEILSSIILIFLSQFL